MKELLEICAALKEQAQVSFAMATVIQVEGSAYRRPGARMLIAASGESWGMISGGCLEHDVLLHARRVMKSGVAASVRYDSTSDEDIIFGTGLGCNGIVDVLIEPVTEQFRAAFIYAVEECHRTRKPGAIATIIGSGTGEALFPQHAFCIHNKWAGPGQLGSLLTDWIPEGEECAILGIEQNRVGAPIFVQPLLPSVQLVIFGGGFDVVPVIRIAKEAGIQTVAVDSRQRPFWASILREADSVLLCSAAEALPQIPFDSRTAAVLMNHHFERDCEALSALTQVSLPYVGVLGPKRRRDKLFDAVRQSGGEITEEFASCLHGPTGLDIGAKNPEQIAVSIIAEILAVLNGRNGKPARDRSMPLHVSSPPLAYA